MGTTSEKLTYLNTTKEKIRDSINLTGANIGTSDTFRSYASKLKKGYIDIINNGIDTLYNNFPKVSGIGSNLSLTPTYEAPMKLNEIQGDTLQDGTPTPNTPVPIQSVTGLQNINVCGKNLINMVETNKAVNNQGNISSSNIIYLGVEDYIPVQPNTTYTITFQHDIVVDGGIANLYIGRKDKDGNFIERTSYYTNRTFTTDANTYYIFPYLNKSGFEFTTIGGYVQLEKGSTATDYEPYKGNTYEVNLGKNIWSVGNKNVGWATNYVDVKNMLNTLSEGTYSITLNFKVTEIVKEKTNNYYGFTFHNSNGHIYNKKNTNSNINVDDNFVYTYTFTISSSQVGNFTSAYFYGFGNDTDDVTARSLMYDCQLEKGNTSTSFSPYFTPIELNKISTYEDRIYKDNGKWYVEKQIGKVVLDGTQDISNRSTNVSGNYRLQYEEINNLIVRPTNGNIVGNILCSHFPVLTANRTYQCNQGVSVEVTGNITFYDLSNTSGNATTFKNWLQSNNVTIIYALATPTYTEITNTELIEDLETLYTAKSQEGTTNISITSEDLEMILNVSALKSE